MGNRCNFGIVQHAFSSEPVGVMWLYQHWGGDGMMKQFANALNAARPRWHDEAYATRIVTNEVFEGYASSTTGAGITFNCLSDNEHSLPVVDFSKGTVSLYPEYNGGLDFPKPKFIMSIDAFVSKFGD